VLRVLKESDYNPEDTIMRVVSFSPAAENLRISGRLAGKWECVNLDETPCEDPADTLGAFEIKTLRRL